MDHLPLEIIDAILQQCAAIGPKRLVLDLRLVCRTFDSILKPIVCHTLQLEFSRLSKSSWYKPPRTEALQTIGYHGKAMFIDLMLLRDELEMEFLGHIFAPIPDMQTFCRRLHETHCMNESNFTETEYRSMVEDMLFNCRAVSRLKVSLPFQLVAIHTNTGTMILAITFEAFARRPEEDSASLDTLVVENLTDVAVCSLWTNPCDVHNIMSVIRPVKYLVLTLRRLVTEPHRVDMFAACLWDMIRNAQVLRTLAIVGNDQDDRPPRGLKQTRHWDIPLDEWSARALPAPGFILPLLTCLELKHVEVGPDFFRAALWSFGGTLEELYLNEVHLKAEQSQAINLDTRQWLWIGLPNQRPPPDATWVASLLRDSAPRLRVCRAAFLAYDHYVQEGVGPAPAAPLPPNSPLFDFTDPCGLGRSLAQRFVEVATGVRQPPTPDGEPLEYLSQDSARDQAVQDVLHDLPGLDTEDVWKVQETEEEMVRHLHGDAPPATGPRHVLMDKRRYPFVEHDTNAYQLAVANTTSGWLKSIDNMFPSLNKYTIEQLNEIAETASLGMNELSRLGIATVQSTNRPQ